MLNKYVSSFRLKLERVSADLTDSGRLFHTVGPATEKARFPNLVFVRETIRRLILMEEDGSVVSFIISDHYLLCCYSIMVVLNRLI